MMKAVGLLLMISGLVGLLALPLSAQKGPQARKTSYVLVSKAGLRTSHVLARCTGEGYLNVAPAELETFNLISAVDKASSAGMGQVAGREKIAYKQDSLLITLSVLPDANGKIVWRPMVADSVGTHDPLMLTGQQVAADALRSVLNYYQAGAPPTFALTTRTDIRPVVQHDDGSYWVPQTPVLTQYFLIRHSHASGTGDFVSINPRAAGARRLGQSEVTPATGIALTQVAGNVLEFSAAPQPNASHPDATALGIEAFKFKPGVGVISAKYPAYFALMGRSTEVFYEPVSIKLLGL